MKIDDIVEVRDGSYSLSLIKGEIQHTLGISLRGCHYRVFGIDGAYPTDRVTNVSGTNDTLLVDVNDPDFVLFTQERFCRVVHSAVVTSAATHLEVTIPRETQEVHLVFPREMEMEEVRLVLSRN